jgi:hypothetical protein
MRTGAIVQVESHLIRKWNALSSTALQPKNKKKNVLMSSYFHWLNKHQLMKADKWGWLYTQLRKPFSLMPPVELFRRWIYMSWLPGEGRFISKYHVISWLATKWGSEGINCPSVLGVVVEKKLWYVSDNSQDGN